MKVCLRCKTENNPDYKYCKTCGAALPFVDQKPIWDYEEERASAEESFSDNGEISTYEMNVFVGKNSEIITPKFTRLEQLGKKNDFCLPVLLLGLFFGVFGVAAYFLYRKMIKPAAIVMAVGIGMTAVSVALNFGTIISVMQAYREMFTAVVTSGTMISESEITAQLSSLTTSENSLVSMILSYINQYVLGVAFPIVAALFTDYIYMEHAISKISEIKEENLPKTEYFLALHKAGGTSGGSVVVGALIYMAAETLLIAIPMIIGFFA